MLWKISADERGLAVKKRVRLNQRFLSLNHSADTWAIYYNFDQYLWNPTISSDSKGGSEVDPTRVVGIFGRIGLADESTNPIAQFYSFGLGGKGACASRPHDRFGVGWYYMRVLVTLEGNNWRRAGRGSVLQFRRHARLYDHRGFAGN